MNCHILPFFINSTSILHLFGSFRPFTLFFHLKVDIVSCILCRFLAFCILNCFHLVIPFPGLSFSSYIFYVILILLHILHLMPLLYNIVLLDSTFINWSCKQCSILFMKINSHHIIAIHFPFPIGDPINTDP